MSITHRLFNPLLKLNFFQSALCTKLQFSTTSIVKSDEIPVDEKPKSAGEQKLIDMLKKRFDTAKLVEAVDISGGCGSMYAVYVESNEFKKMRIVKQHQLVTEVLKAEIKDNMHGVRIQTAVPEE